MAIINQIRYETINCTSCGEGINADLTAFNFNEAFAKVVEVYGLNDWEALAKLDLKFFYTIRDLCQDFQFECDFYQYKNLAVRIRHIKRHLEYIIKKEKLIDQGLTFDDLNYMNSNSPAFNSIYESIHGRDNSVEFLADFRQLLRNLCSENEEDIIFTLPLKMKLSRDDVGNEIPIGFAYKVDGKEYVMDERVCPVCGNVFDPQAGFRHEYVIGMVGLSRVGKTTFLASLLHQLKALDKDFPISVHFGDNENDSLHSFERDILSEYEQGKPVLKTEVENEKAIPLVYVSIRIQGTEENFIFVDMPGEIFSDASDSEGLNFISNKRSIIKNADVIWCFIEPCMLNARYRNKNVVNKEDDSIIQLSNLVENLQNIFLMKKPCCVIITQSDLMKNDHPELFRPDLSTMAEFLTPGGELSLNMNRFNEHVADTRRMIDSNMLNLRMTVKDAFDGFTTVSVASYGYDVSEAINVGKRLQPSLVELPFLWTLALPHIHKIKATRIFEEKGFFSKKVVQQQIQDPNQLIQLLFDNN